MKWKSIRLELGSTGEFPAGSVSRAYLMRLPLDDQDAIDGTELARHPRKAVVRRHWSSEPDQRGLMVRWNGAWSIQCDGTNRTLHLDSRPVRLGEQVSLVEANGDVVPLRIASIR